MDSGRPQFVLNVDGTLTYNIGISTVRMRNITEAETKKIDFNNVRRVKSANLDTYIDQLKEEITVSNIVLNMMNYFLTHEFFREKTIEVIKATAPNSSKHKLSPLMPLINFVKTKSDYLSKDYIGATILYGFVTNIPEINMGYLYREFLDKEYEEILVAGEKSKKSLKKARDVNVETSNERETNKLCDIKRYWGELSQILEGAELRNFYSTNEFAAFKIRTHASLDPNTRLRVKKGGEILAEKTIADKISLLKKRNEI